MDPRAARARRLGAALVLALSLGAVPDAGIPDPAASLRAARAAHAAGQQQQALRELLPLESGPLADHALLIRAQWLRAAGDRSGALTAAGAALAGDPPPELVARIQSEIAQIQVEEQELARAYRAQEQAWSATRSNERAAELAFELAQVFEQQSLPGDALRLYRLVWERWPRTRRSGDAFERSRFLAEATGAPTPEAVQLISYADGLRTSYQCDRALDVYESLLATEELDAALRSKAARGEAHCLFQRRRYDEARTAYLALARGDPDDVDSAIRAARCDARSGKSERAIGELSAIARRTRKSERARAQYLVALILRERDPESAQRLWKRVESQQDAPGLARLARWRLAWDDLRGGDREAAIKRLHPLTRGSIWDIEVQRARYWTAVARLEADPERGTEGLTELAERIPLAYYGLLSADRLGTSPRVGESFLDGDDKLGPYGPEQRALWLLEGGFPDAARIEVEGWVLGARLTRSERVAAAGLLHAVGEHFRAVRILVDGFGGTFEQGIDPGWQDAWLSAWPQPFGSAVQAATREFEFDPSLVYAVMREESTYRPDVESPAGAIGLMQIIPPTGDQIASSLGVSSFAAERLLDPTTNIRFGTWYLKHLMGVFDGSRPLAIAAYNAGPDAVSSWLERDGHLPDDAFVDSVPYSETRRYVRRVLRSWRVYQLLYEEDSLAQRPTAQP